MASEIITVEDHPRVISAMAALKPLRDRRTELEQEHRAAFAIGGYTNRYTGDPIVSATEEELVRARLRLRRLDDELAELRLREIPCERTVAAARDAAKAEVAAAILKAQKVDVAEMDRLFQRLVAVNGRVAARDEQAQAAVGFGGGPRFAWHELFAETPLADSRLAAWRRSCREHGVLA